MKAPKQSAQVVKSAAALLLVMLLSHRRFLVQVAPREQVEVIEPGEKVSVRLNSGKTVNGKIEAWSTISWPR